MDAELMKYFNRLSVNPDPPSIDHASRPADCIGAILADILKLFQDYVESKLREEDMTRDLSITEFSHHLIVGNPYQRAEYTRVTDVTKFDVPATATRIIRDDQVGFTIGLSLEHNQQEFGMAFAMVAASVYTTIKAHAGKRTKWNWKDVGVWMDIPDIPSEERYLNFSLLFGYI